MMIVPHLLFWSRFAARFAKNRSLLVLVLASLLQAQESVFPANALPAIASDGDTQRVELGMKFRTAQAGRVLGVKFYKGPLNAGLHTGSLWDTSGKLLARVQFTNETASGWQTANFETPVNISANTTYVVSYHCPNGRYSINSGFFASSETKRGNLTALRGTTNDPNGVYVYGASAYPNQSWNSSNYWVDVLFTSNSPLAPPSAALTSSASLWPATTIPANTAAADSQAVELGVKFRSNTAGRILGIRFFKGPGNGGTHVARLWSREGSLLGTAEFTGETPTGWQQANFATPISIDAQKVYVATYHAPQGRYAINTGFFKSPVSSGPLTALQDGTDGGNGVYRYGNGGVFPTSTYLSSNYWVDVAFEAAPASPLPAPIPPPTISSQPASRSVLVGEVPSFSVTAAGSGNLSYQWQKGATNIPGATAATYTLPPVTLADNGSRYRVVITNAGGSTTSNEAILTVNTPPPSITSQPVSRSVNAGESAVFSVVAASSSMLTYQWHKNGTNIMGATGSSYATGAASAGDNGSRFRVIVSSNGLSVTSSEATLTVNTVAPRITTQPANTTVTVGSTASFSVTATGSAPLTYAWRKNNVLIPGATANSYVTPATALSDNTATYTVTIVNSAGSITSNPAVLTVNATGSSTILTAAPPTLNVGETSTLTAVVTQTGLSSTIPSGQVEFLNGSGVLATVNLDSTGKATFLWKSPATPGTVSLRARYKGNSTIAPSESAVLPLSVLSILTNGSRPPSPAEAARFLNQATFGPTKADVDYLMEVGYEKWFEEQFGPDKDPTYIDTLKKMWASGVPFALAPQHKYNYTGWYSVVVPGKSQLRLRMEWALSQIFVVSNQSIDSPQRLLYYGDLLRKNAFGTYRKLLDEVAWSAPMAIMLSYTPNFWNGRGDNIPDQNMARELMQLFSIGLWELNPDGTQKLKDGAPISTYTAADIVGLSHVFTGLGTVENRNDPDGYVNRLMNRMESYPPGYRSQIEKKFLGKSIPASPAGTRLASDDIPIALDTVAAHPNVAPFLSKQLIQRFVTSNPSPGYVARVAAVWNNSGGVRGDLKAVLKAILMDPEARDPQLAYRPESGKIREFALRLGNFYRWLNVAMPAGALFGGNNPDTQYWQGYTSEIDIQHPYYAPTVFNWYRPGFAPPGTDLDKANLVAPEMQIITTDTTLQWSNFIKDSLDRGGVGSMDYSNPTNRFQWTEWTALASDTNALIDRINLLMFSGQMSDTTRQALTKSITSVAGNGTTDSSRLNRVKVAFTLAFVAPDYIVQK